MSEPETFTRFYVEAMEERHREEIEQLRAEFNQRLERLQAKVAQPQHPRPSVIHPDDFAALSQSEYERENVGKRLLSGELTVSTDAPKGKWRQPVRKLSMAEFRSMSQSEFEKIDKAILSGEIEIVG